MSWDLLLHWMTHVGEGAWAGFRDAVANLAPADADLPQLCRSKRIWLSDLAHADFFLRGSQRWHVLPPVLAGLSTIPHSAILTGGQTPKLISALAEAADACGCSMAAEYSDDHPTTIRVTGTEKALSDASAAVGMRYVGNYDGALSQQLTPIQELIKQASIESAPHNWTAKYFDFRLMTWIDGVGRHAACEFSSRYSVRRYYVHLRRGTFLQLPRREAVYAAAMLQRVTLIQYNLPTHELRVPVTTPLPQMFSRSACLCTGVQARVENGHIIYNGVPPATAAVLIVAAGQPHPGFEFGAAGMAQKGAGHGQSI